jgi:membrane associated rhomboid family serine protease
MRGATVLQSNPLVDIASLIPLPVWQAVLVGGVLASVGLVYAVVRPDGRWSRRLRARLLLGLPWGTLAGIALIYAVFWVVQGGWGNSPVTYAFQATSFTYPLGVLTAAFSHGSYGHLFGNAAGALVFGWVAEYGYSHFPTGRGETAFARLRTNPYVRPLAFFACIVLAGLLTAAFSWGPIIGFSGVVFALAGFAVVVRPLLSVVALAVANIGLVSKLDSAINNPVTVAQPTPNSGGVWFADVAIQGHLFGFLLGALFAGYLLWRRGEQPDTGRVYFAALLFGLGQGLWVAYWYLGNSRYVLFRTAGTVFVFLLVAFIAVAVSRVGTDAATAARRSLRSLSTVDINRQTVAALTLILLVVGMSATGVALNLRDIEGTDLPNDPVEVRDYRVGYTENTTNQQISNVVPGLDAVTDVEASGVIVASADRNIWQVAASAQRLRLRGAASVTVGGPGWRETVYVTRTGWSVVGGDTTYRVRLHPPDGDARTVFRSDPVTSEVVIANRSISVRTVEERFEVVVTRGDEALGVGEFPDDGANATVAGIRFERSGRQVYANYEGTRVQVASKQDPGLQRFR